MVGGPVDEHRLLRLGGAGQQGALGCHAGILGVAQRAGLMSVAGLVAELEHPQIGHAARQKIHHRQVTGGNGRILEHLLKNDAGNPPGQVDEIRVAGQLLGKG